MQQHLAEGNGVEISAGSPGNPWPGDSSLYQLHSVSNIGGHSVSDNCSS